MTKLKHASRHALAACAAFALGTAWAGAAQAARAPRKPPPDPDIVSDFKLLAQQRPWACPAPAPIPDLKDQAWTAGDAGCAWQNRLSTRRWTWTGDALPACVSTQARWWAQAQAGLPPGAARSVWHAGWTARSALLADGDGQRLLAVERGRDGRWAATEWRWNPNPRPATRRWQQGRWQLLVDAVRKAAPQQADGVAPDTARVQTVFAAMLGKRPGEIGAAGMAMASGGICMSLSNPLPGQSKLPLSYNATDSRLEQRAATHLQLSRQLPNADWLTPFKLLAVPAAPAGGAKFLATWIEGDQLNSQLWIPEKTGGHTLRVRMSTRLAPGLAAHPDAAPVARAKQMLEHELEAFASQWAARHE